MKISPARLAAFDCLTKIESGSLSSTVLAESEADLSVKDRALCHAIVLGVLRRQIYLDRIIDAIATGKRLDPAVRISLRIGLFQILDLDRIPPHSAVNDSVELVKRARKSSAQGLVNAVLRGAIRHLPNLAFVDEIDRLSAETSHPRWLIERWIDEFGLVAAVEMLKANNDHPRIAFRMLVDCPETVELTRRSIRSDWVDAYYLAADANAGQIANLAAASKIYLQDEASQMIAASVRIPPGGRGFDMCAAPGGKTGIIAKNGDSDSVLVAGDRTDRRVRLLRHSLTAQGLADKVPVLQYDAEVNSPLAEASFDTVFVDAPCSGTGTIRANPEIRYRLDSRTLERFSSKQLAILINASKLVRPGGELIYATCSIEARENEDVCTEFLGRGPDFDLVTPRLHRTFVTDRGFARTWPPRDKMDGFFTARFVRRS